MTVVTGSIKPIKNNVMVNNMHFGEQTTKGGVVILNDNGKSEGIYPRWAQVYAVGPEHKEEYNVGDWILIEHGRWTRGIEIQPPGQEEKDTIRMVEVKSVLLWSDQNPNLVN